MVDRPPKTEQRRFMRRALKLARRGRGRVSPNPLVGAVVVRDGRIVGEGTHFYDQRDHAETLALEAAGEAAAGADLYVNLEPCAHQGRTPPCVERIASAGIRRLFYGVADPGPAGGGAGWLSQHGIQVRGGILEGRCRRLNEVFLHWVATGRPFVLLKLGMSLDGRIAGPRRDSRWITGERARRRVHRLRHEYDAILVGIRTVLHDDPSLDDRGKKRSAIEKIVLDSRLRTPPDARLFESGDPVTVFHAPGAVSDELARRARLVEVPGGRAGLQWGPVLGDLAGRSLTSLLVEGGGRVAASALEAGIIDKVNFFYGPVIVGDQGVAGVGDLGVVRLSDALRLSAVRTRRLGDDVLVEGYPAARRTANAEARAAEPD